MDESPKTPRTGTPALPPPRPLPTIANVHTTVEVLVGHVKNLRLEVEALSKLITDPPPEVLRVPRLPSPESLVPPSTPTVATPAPSSRPSMAAKAAKDAGKFGRALMVATGVLTIAGQIASLWRPEYTGPIEQALRLLKAIVGAE